MVRKNGIKTEQVQYYHRAVGCQIISSPVKSFAALEWLQLAKARKRLCDC